MPETFLGDCCQPGGSDGAAQPHTVHAALSSLRFLRFLRRLCLIGARLLLLAAGYTLKLFNVSFITVWFFQKLKKTYFSKVLQDFCILFGVIVLK